MPDTSSITFAGLITPPGIILAGVIIATLVQILKAVFPRLNDKVNGLQQSFLFAAVLYGLTAIVLSPMQPDGYLWVFTAWLSCVGAAVASYEATVRGALLKTPTENSNTPPVKPIIGRNEKFDEP